MANLYNIDLSVLLFYCDCQYPTPPPVRCGIIQASFEYKKSEKQVSKKTTGLVLLSIGAVLFMYGVFTASWFITVIGGAIAGIGVAGFLSSRRQT